MQFYFCGIFDLCANHMIHSRHSNDFKKNLKKGIGIKSEKVYKQVRDQIVWKRVEDTAEGLLWNGNKF